MIWRPCQWDIEVGPDLFQSLSNKISIKSSWTSIALRMTELWPSQWFIIGLPTNRKFNFTFVSTIKDWHVQVEPSELYQKSLCKYRNKLTLYLTIMVVSIGFMSSSKGLVAPNMFPSKYLTESIYFISFLIYLFAN